MIPIYADPVLATGAKAESKVLVVKGDEGREISVFLGNKKSTEVPHILPAILTPPYVLLKTLRSHFKVTFHSPE